MSTEAGRHELKANSQKAEELYLKSLQLDHPVPVAHRGLGMLYEKLGRAPEASEEYQKYLDLAPDALRPRKDSTEVARIEGVGEPGDTTQTLCRSGGPEYLSNPTGYDFPLAPFGAAPGISRS